MLTSTGNIVPSFRRVHASTSGSGPCSSAAAFSANRPGGTSGEMSDTVSASSSSTVYPPICAWALAFT